jgi:hypothetical protein
MSLTLLGLLVMTLEMSFPRRRESRNLIIGKFKYHLAIIFSLNKILSTHPSSVSLTLEKVKGETYK